MSARTSRTHERLAAGAPDNDEGPRTTNDVVAIVFLQPAGRIDVLGIPDEGNLGSLRMVNPLMVMPFATASSRAS
jgi:hypothetical protein